MNPEAFLARLDGVNHVAGGWQARCPCRENHRHDDRNPSLSVRGAGSRILVHCHVGCSVRSIVAAMGLEMRDLFADGGGGRPRIVAEYDYVNERGEQLFQVVRFEPKDFRQRRPDGSGGLTWKLDGVRRVLYRLPEVLAAQSVLIVEGERDVDSARSLGLTATCNPGGAGKWRNEYSEALRGKRIAIIADADPPGRKHACEIATSLYGTVESLKVDELPGAKDLSDWLVAGGTKDALLGWFEEIVPEWAPPGARAAGAQAAIETTTEKCPALPETAWYGLSSEYRGIVGGRTEASHNYHLGCFLSAVGACLGRSVCIEKAGRHYPNLFVVLVGPSGGARKGTALGFGVNLAQAILPKIGIVRSLDSREGFIDHLANLGKQQEESAGGSTIVRLAEFRSLIEKTRMEGLGNIVPMLCDAYDCPPSLEVHTRKNPVSVSNPTVSLLAATTHRWIEGLSDKDLEGGLGNRIMWIPGEPGEAIPHPPALNHERWNTLACGLSNRIESWRQKRSTEFSFSPAAAARWEKIYAELYAHRSDDPLIAILCERLQNHCLKVALIFAALDGSAIIELHQLEAAYAYTQFLYDGLWYLFRGYGMSPMAQLDAKIIQAVKDAGPSGIRLPQLKKRFWRTDMELFNRRLQHLTVNDGPLLRFTDGRKVIISLADT